MVSRWKTCFPLKRRFPVEPAVAEIVLLWQWWVEALIRFKLIWWDCGPLLISDCRMYYTMGHRQPQARLPAKLFEMWLRSSSRFTLISETDKVENAVFQLHLASWGLTLTCEDFEGNSIGLLQDSDRSSTGIGRGSIGAGCEFDRSCWDFDENLN